MPGRAHGVERSQESRASWDRTDVSGTGLDDQRRAARVVAARAIDVEDCRDLLEMLGLSRAVGLPVADPPPR